MKAQVLRGTREEIAETLLRVGGGIREAIVFVEEPSGPSEDPSGDVV